MSDFAGWINSGSTGAEALGKMWGKLFTSGFALGLTPTAYQVTQRGSGANMSVDIAVGSGLEALTDYSVPIWSSATINKIVTAADPSNPRNDIVVVYIDLTAYGANNNSGATKFMIVSGTPAGSPSDPSDPTIQSAVGAGNPWKKLARIVVPANAPSIVNAYITDLRAPIAFAGNLYGGNLNTNGHAVPNAADGNVLIDTATQAVQNKTFDNTNTFTAPKFRSLDAWVDANETWTYASANTITVPTDATTKYDVGDYIKLTQTTVKYFIITAVAPTLLTVQGMTPGALETVANSAITANYYSKARSPHGLPAGVGGAWQTWSPTYANLTIGNGIVTAVYTQIGKTVHFRFIFQLGSTSAVGNNPAITLPVAAASTYAGGAIAEYANIGVAKLLHSGVQNCSGYTYLSDTTHFGPQTVLASGTYASNGGLSSTVPFTWVTGDAMFCAGTYEAA